MQLFGDKLDSQRLNHALEHIFQTNCHRQERGERGTPVCIWGTHGLGKTTVVQDYAKNHGWQFVYIAPAQFEEMGDLHGMPRINANGATEYAHPEWVPQTEGPGILLIDDINRADDRILRGIMQLLQNFEMRSWKLPKKWQIVATANPEGGDYSVTTMDDAMLTRMLHVTMTFDVKSWSKWASVAGVDPRGISFVLTYPEVITGKRTTPRSMVQFFDQISGITDLKLNMELVHTLGMSSLDETTVATFVSFVNDNLSELIDPEEILDTKEFKKISDRIEKLANSGAKGGKRVDRLATICTRLYLALTHPGYKPQELHGKNVVNFLLLDTLPNDLRVSLHKDLLGHNNPEVTAMMRDKRLAEIMLAGM